MSGLRDQVSVRFRETGADTPGWPPPRPLGAQPSEEEYSRLLDPGKYRILAARLAAWRQVLRAREVDPGAVAPSHPVHPPDRVVRWLPAAAGALPLTLAFRSLEQVRDAVVDLGVGDPVLWALTLPDCGCDACDCGSEDLLEHLDGFVEMVVTGAYLRVDTPSGYVQTIPNGGWEARDVPDPPAVLDAARAGAGPHRVTTGPAWR